MYEAFYGLNARPFLTVPDPDFIYWTDAHALAFSMLQYGLMTRAPITVVTGEIGAGKTTLIRRLLQETPADLRVGLVSNMQIGRGQLLQWILMALGEAIRDEPYVELFRRFQDIVIATYGEGSRVVLIFDEAQNLDVATLEELRMLSNINADKDELLQIILVGQPQLRALLGQPELHQFSQRISADFHLEVMNHKDTMRYIEYRLEVAGAAWRIFPSETCQLIYESTRGVPRLINILCDLCLIYGYAAERKVVGADLLQEFLNMSRQRGIYAQFWSRGEDPVQIRKSQ